MIRRRHVSALFAFLAMAPLVTACGASGSGSGTAASAVPQTSPAIAPSSAAGKGASVTPAQFCGFLSNGDLIPLVKPPLRDGPKPSEEDGLPGCDWSLGDTDAHLVLSLFKAPQPAALEQSASSTFQISPDATGYVTVPGLLGSCMALVRTHSSPEGIFLRYSLRSYDDRLQGCEPGFPQVRKVLGELGW